MAVYYLLVIILQPLKSIYDGHPGLEERIAEDGFGTG